MRNISISDVNWIALLFFLYLVLFVTSILAPSLQPVWYTIDLIIMTFNLFGIIFSMAPEGNIISQKMKAAVTYFYNYGSMDSAFTKNIGNSQTRLKLMMFFGLIGGIAIILPSLLGIKAVDFSIVLPTLALSLTGALTAQIFTSDFVVTFIQPVIEETWRAGIMDKTIAGWSTTYLGIGITIMLTGVLIMFLLFSTAFFIGLILMLFGAAFTYLTKNKRSYKPSPNVNRINRQMGIFASAIIFGGLHGYSLTLAAVPNIQGAIIGVIIFGVLLSEIDYALNSVVPSIIIHSMWNAIAFASGIILYEVIGLIISGLLAYIVYYLFSPITQRR
jgi:hypothetical protein